MEDAELGVVETDVWAAFEPFVYQGSSAPGTAWRSDVRNRKLKLLKRTLRKLLRSGERVGRGSEEVLGEYERAWSRAGYDNYDPQRRPSEGTPWQWRGRHLLASDIGATRARQLLLARAIQRLGPRTVLEVGCGNGINLLILAGMLPQVEFHGVELTDAGHRAARRQQALEALPEQLGRFSPLPVEDPHAFRRVRFHQGTAQHLEFADAQFDLVITVLAVEQMERIRDIALGEIARVARRHVIMIEPFRDVNRGFWRRLNVYQRGYFKGAIADLADYGLNVEIATDDFPQEVFLGACFVLAHKRDVEADLQGQANRGPRSRSSEFASVPSGQSPSSVVPHAKN